ncbi:MAG TPA: NAD(P)/FAD-dependent oxidoreductase, partial [Sandaracinaceae bacterium LLY-WYZ-13_1]|nr:NAD(P)/FAD-dependent oxidoreductase [Sandaracinaceae bacterium LLY-WYZ-13_1]
RAAERGVRVRRGLAFSDRGRIGELSFARCPAPHRYVLSVPQRVTEATLRAALLRRDPDALVTGAEVHDLSSDRHGVRVSARVDGRERTFEAPHAVACDGRRSPCRRALGIAFDGGAYPGSYVMGDAPDDTGLGARAGIFLGREGLVESFPLPGGIRRWVARRGTTAGDGSAEELCRTVAARTGHRVDPARVEHAGTFVAERREADRFVDGRVTLAGDAAHVLSPIGGQGLNVGWLGAWSLGAALVEALGGDRAALRRDARRRRRIARAATRRAELNMWLGRPGRGGRPLVRAALRRPFGHGLARLFTMRGLRVGL